ncbi:hypothetical protein [Cellulomonas terrae]|uniref:hypothetical protein n=1 Tax=Cellulomonas terrae TaxID=311234 RepID=UPI001FE6F22A|nr:hypothetical protein [Cellulomonas terrae]
MTGATAGEIQSEEGTRRSYVRAGTNTERGDAFEFLAGWGQSQASPTAPGGSGHSVVPTTRWEYMHAMACLEVSGHWVPAGDDGGCISGVPQAPALDCAGQGWVEPRWRRFQVPPATDWSPWRRVDYGSCGGDELPVLTAEEFRRLPLPAPSVHMQPDTGWVLVNKETIAYTDPTPVTLTTQLLGRTVTVEATPTRFTYEWGDGSRPVVTSDPGAPYPAFDVVHVYEDLGQAAITITTEWSGRYQVEGDPQWREVTGTATTTATGPVFEIREVRTRLVTGLCTDDPKPDDC